MTTITELGVFHGVGQPTRTWGQTAGMQIAGRTWIDQADQTAADMEAKWGADRLRRLVSPELREKFDRQRYLFNQAIWHGDLEQVRRESERMIRAWLALDRAATEGGATKLSPQVWEVALADGSVAAIVPDSDHANAVIGSGRRIAVYTLDEIGRMIAGYDRLTAIKTLAGACDVVAVRRNVSDPLLDIADSDKALDAPLEDAIPF